MAKKAGGKNPTIKTSKGSERLRAKDIQIDDDFFSEKRNIIEMEKAWNAKFTHHKIANDILLKTRDAILKHFTRGNPPETWINLMKLRDELIAQKKVPTKLTQQYI